MLHSRVPLNASAEDGLQVCRHPPFHDVAAVLCAPAALLLAQRCLHGGAAQESFTLLHITGRHSSADTSSVYYYHDAQAYRKSSTQTHLLLAGYMCSVSAGLW